MMNTNIGPHHVLDLSAGRRIWVNTLELSWPAHAMFGLLEVDVTEARRIIADYKQRTGETLSFAGFLTYCLAHAVDEDKSIQAYRKGDKHLLLCDDVNVGLMVERTVGEKTALMGHVIQGANHKTYREIHDEIRRVQTEPVPPGRGMPNWFRSLMLLPWPLSKLVLSLLRLNSRRDPTVSISMGGTVALTSVGLFGGGHSGWGLSPTLHPLGLVVGGIAWKPAVVEGKIEPREILNLTVTFDHDIVDGGPATRFVKRLLELIESGYGLSEVDDH
ncbi:MAG TPA: 2-oxo acid dehydrogenase subunit E2 [Anaerolineales bacterium]|nr:2-oxo acid dehydrogenase subunit E2 [Anaerolineales bacterium]